MGFWRKGSSNPLQQNFKTLVKILFFQLGKIKICQIKSNSLSSFKVSRIKRSKQVFCNFTCTSFLHRYLFENPGLFSNLYSSKSLIELWNTKYGKV